MENVTFQAIVKKGNNKGVGFIAIPRELRNNFRIVEQLKVIINSGLSIHAKIRFYNTLGFYVPHKIMNKHNLTNKSVQVEIEKIDGFYTSVGYDGIIYLPNHIAKNLGLRHNNILEIEGLINGVKEIKYPMVGVRVREKTTEYYCLFDNQKSGMSGIFKIIRRLEVDENLSNLLIRLHYGNIDQNTIVVYNGNHQPVIINKNIKLSNITHYLGCYFADGTKRGVNWGICASTFEQANYYHLMHQLLVKTSKIVPYISFTDTKNKEKSELTEYLRNIWISNVYFLPENLNVRIINSKCKPSLKTNKFGTLVLRENRQLTQIYYNRLLQSLFKEIKLKNSKGLALDFLFGVLEGDGSVSPHLGHLVIATNNKELVLLKEVLDITGVKYNVRIEGINKSCVHIGLLEIIRNISILKDKIFIYYPKRRNLLKERLLNTASVKVLLGQNKKTSNWLIGQFNEMNILDGNGNLTEFGIKVKEDLKEFLSQ